MLFMIFELNPFLLFVVCCLLSLIWYLSVSPTSRHGGRQGMGNQEAVEEKRVGDTQIPYTHTHSINIYSHKPHLNKV